MLEQCSQISQSVVEESAQSCQRSLVVEAIGRRLFRRQVNSAYYLNIWSAVSFVVAELWLPAGLISLTGDGALHKKLKSERSCGTAGKDLGSWAYCSG